MSYILASLSATKSRKTGIGIFDTEKGELIYLQVLDTLNIERRNIYRGLCSVGDKIFALTDSSLVILGCNYESSTPLFTIQKWITFPECLHGGTASQLVAISKDDSNQSVYIGNNGYGSVDQYSLEGNLLDRRYFWEIAPDIFSSPTGNNDLFQAKVRAMFSDMKGNQYCTITLRNENEKGFVLCLNDGKIVVDGLQSPHGGCISNNVLYVQSIKERRLIAYDLVSQKTTLDGSVLFSSSVELVEDLLNTNNQVLRWTLAVDEDIYCGSINLEHKIGTEWIPQGIVGFNKNSGELSHVVKVPEINGFPRARPFAIALPPESLKERLDMIEEPVIFDRNTGAMAKNNGNSSGIAGSSSCQVEEGDDFLSGNELNPAGKNVIHFDNVGLMYLREAQNDQSSRFWKFRKEEFWAVRNLSLIINEGETVGIIGRNGSGKTTTSLLCSGVYTPDEGTVHVQGRVQLLSIGVGFKNELTGYENALISGALLGIPRREMKSLVPEIEKFAEIGAFMNQPVRTYSAGMRSRLGFAISTVVAPDILILDEAMSTGDHAFKKKAIERLSEIHEKTGTVILISHSLRQVKNICTRVIWLEHGRLIMDGNPENVVSAYIDFCDSPTRNLEKYSDGASELVVSGEV